MMKKKHVKIPKIYLDTVIMREIIEKKPAFLLNLMRTIKERKWQCFTSTYAILELCELKKDDVYLSKSVGKKLEYKTIIRGRDKKKLNPDELRTVENYVAVFLNKYSNVTVFQVPKEAWEDALTITLNSNVQVKDAIHLAAALNSKANVILTNDKHFTEEANTILQWSNLSKNTKVILPDKIYDTLAILGFEIE